jgi:hypothetical protein
MNLLEKLDLLVGLSAAKRTSLALFDFLLSDCGMSWIELFKQYTGRTFSTCFAKNVTRLEPILRSGMVVRTTNT